MMYGLDTHEHDLSTRQVNRIVECKTALLQLDTLYESEQAKLDTILVRSMGVEKSDRSAKFALLFSWRIVQIAWYIGPFLLALLFAVFYEFYTNKKHPLINRWLTVEEEPPVSPHS
jgi:predicted exporter